MKKIIFTISILIFPFISFAHPGRTDSSGCHTCRTNCAKWGLSSGEYHCHNSKGVPQPVEPVKSHYSETGGYTTPAPEYKSDPTPVVKTPEPAKITPAIVRSINTEVPKIQTQPKEEKSSWLVRFFRFIF